MRAPPRGVRHPGPETRKIKQAKTAGRSDQSRTSERDCRTREEAAGRKRIGRLFQKFHKEPKMAFAKNIWPGLLALAAAATTANAPALAQQPQKPNILSS